MKTWFRQFLGVATLCLPLVWGATGCELEPKPRTQVVVLLDAAPSVAKDLRKVEVEVWDGEGTRSASRAEFELASRGTGGDQASFPLSFGVTRASAAQFLVSVLGFDANGTLVIETRARAAFVDGQTRMLPLLLSEVCRGELTCQAPVETCYPAPADGVAASACGPARLLPTHPLGSQAEARFEWPAEVLEGPSAPEEPNPPTEGGAPALDAGAMDGGRDAGVAGGDGGGGADAGGEDAGDADAGQQPDATVTAPPPARSGYLVYSGSQVGGPRELFAVRIEEGVAMTPQKVSEAFADGDVQFVTAVPGRSALYYGFEPSGSFQTRSLYYLDLSGGLPGIRTPIVEDLAEDRGVRLGMPSPNGDYFIYSVLRPEGGFCYDTFLVPLTSSGPGAARRIGNGGPDSTVPSRRTHWIGSELFYVEQDDCIDWQTSNHSMHRYDAARPNLAPVQITEGPLYPGIDPWSALSPDGRRLLYATVGEDGLLTFYRAQLGTDGASMRTEVTGSDFRVAEFFSYPSKNLEHLAFLADARGPTRELFLADERSPTGAYRLHENLQQRDDLFLYRVDWSDDSTLLGYIMESAAEDGSLASADLRVVDIEAGPPFQFTTVVDDYNVEYFRFSPDSTVVFVQTTETVPEPRIGWRAFRVGESQGEEISLQFDAFPEGTDVRSTRFSPSGAYVTLEVEIGSRRDVYITSWADFPSAGAPLGDIERPAEAHSIGLNTFLAGDEFVVGNRNVAGATTLFLTASDGSSTQEVTQLTDLGITVWIPDPPSP